MSNTTSITKDNEANKGGRTGHTARTTAPHDSSQSAMALVIFILIDHDFVNELHTGTPERLNKLYLHFTREVVALYHSSGNRDEIRSALVLAEEHLAVILESMDRVFVVSINLICRALKFLQKYLTDETETETSANENGQEDTEMADDADEMRIYTVAEMPTFGWTGKFTEVVQFIESIIDMEYISNCDKNASAFKRLMLDIFGFKEKTLSHYHASRHKQCMKIIKTENNKKRCSFLYDLFTNLEKSWHSRFERIQ